jgi:E3 ubiquitin-protein ligase DOA10
MARLAKQKFNANVNVAFETCAICLMEFTAEDEITPLPCDEKHYFHTSCIEEWLKNNNICPLCKKPITEEGIN